jgi:hypothetical protein
VLLSLKRHEKPSSDYLEQFLQDFHARCREDSMRRGRSLSLWQRLVDGFAEPGVARWAYGAGLAYAGVLMAVILLPQERQAEGLPLQPANHPVVPPELGDPVGQLDELDFRPSTEPRLGEQEF